MTCKAENLNTVTDVKPIIVLLREFERHFTHFDLDKKERKYHSTFSVLSIVQ